MAQTKADWVQYLTLLSVAFLLVGSFTWMQTEVNVPTAKEIADNIQIGDNSEILSALEGVQNTLDKDDIWKDEAIAIANAEWSKRDYKAIYKVLDDIDEREDIEEVIIKDSEVTSYDVDDSDATVIQELKVYYENEDGRDVKDYVIVETIIEEGEVENQDISLK